jgi:CheY-like chemotaxis protein
VSQRNIAVGQAPVSSNQPRELHKYISVTGVTSSEQPLVLIVDDDADVLETMGYMLGARGFRVVAASSKTEALAICEQYGGRIDALVADLSLPGDVPGGLAKAIAAAYPGIKIVYASGIPRQIALSQGLVRPDAPYLVKPVAPDLLAGQLSSVLNR